MKTLKEYIAEQDNKISVPMEGVLASLEKVLEDGVSKAVEDFRVEAEKTKEEMITELREKTQEASDYVNSLTPIKGDQGETVIGPEGVRGLRGEKGDKGDSIIGPKGIRGEPGINGSPDSGKEIIGKINAEDEEKIDASKIKNLPKAISIFGQSKAYFKVITISGVINDVNTVFTLSEAPKYGTQLFVLLDNTLQELTQNYTLSGNTLTYTFAPQTGQRHFGIIFRP